MAMGVAQSVEIQPNPKVNVDFISQNIRELCSAPVSTVVIKTR
jgi:hypothetical protein